jgi:pyochelin biosynthetic protein PchC
MAARAAAGLARLDPLSCALFGHSLGALVAYETARALRDAGRPPRHLLVSGAAPPKYAGGGRTHLASDGNLWSAVRALGALEPEIAEDDELADILLPALRADISAHERYRPRPGIVPLACPVRCYYGACDPLVDRDLLAGWADVSTGAFTLEARPGAHFYLFEDANGLAAEVMGAVAMPGSPTDGGKS